MKVNPLTTSILYPTRVREKQEHDSLGHGSGHHSSKDQDTEQKEGEEPLTYDQVEHAVAEFSADQQAQANGLNASVQGRGPGLRVVLTDRSGVVVRQFSGEEFLKLRQVVGKDSKLSGKILDRKC